MAILSVMKSGQTLMVQNVETMVMTAVKEVEVTKKPLAQMAIDLHGPNIDAILIITTICVRKSIVAIAI